MAGAEDLRKVHSRTVSQTQPFSASGQTRLATQMPNPKQAAAEAELARRKAAGKR